METAGFASSGEQWRSSERRVSPTHFRLWCDDDGHWRVASSELGLSGLAFAELATAVAFAKQACRQDAAIVELQIDGLSVVIHQERGWPKPIC
jgi:hypothetical protein